MKCEMLIKVGIQIFQTCAISAKEPIDNALMKFEGTAYVFNADPIN